MGYKILDSGNGYSVMYADYPQGIGHIGQEFCTVHTSTPKSRSILNGPPASG